MSSSLRPYPSLAEIAQTPFDDSLYPLLCDAHCHPHDDIDNLATIPQLKVGHVTVMGVREADWGVVEQVVRLCGEAWRVGDVGKAVPCFVFDLRIPARFPKLTGVHPWFVHTVCSPTEPQSTSADYNHDTRYANILTSNSPADIATLIPTLPDPTPFPDWSARLRQNLLAHPYAIVGEVGLDRSARLLPPGADHWAGIVPTSVRCSQEHQMAVLGAQLDLAWEIQRAASVHCVQAYGGLLELLKEKTKEWGSAGGGKKRGKGKKQKEVNDDGQAQAKPSTSTSASSSVPHPPLRICVHSYGGSVDMIRSLLSLPPSIVRCYFSFSVAINDRLGPRLDDLICAVLDDRLLLESDFNSPQGVDPMMKAICERVAKARGWGCEQVARRTHANWWTFVVGEEGTEKARREVEMNGGWVGKRDNEVDGVVEDEFAEESTMIRIIDTIPGADGDT
ncbi:hypothetical protein BC938DRAFT_476165 [Jimgerdemannia flammicorona]|uniref:Amidohydrolase-related domain-containing protein n=1 Tax=Jimgerdemannia flammicorona TaxID=994334 RepID=A0A433QQT9_9FUNG|nr:hypothetical protein BC938DRAFT_476165 [Jimgerdemannia flammicorona]